MWNHKISQISKAMLNKKEKKPNKQEVLHYLTSKQQAIDITSDTQTSGTQQRA
jgi:hypothetical protein